MSHHDEATTYYATRGAVALHHYDRQRILDIARESRRRMDAENPQASQLIDTYVAAVRQRRDTDLGPTPEPVDVLLHAITSAAAFACEGADAGTVLTILTRMASDMEQQHPR
ncbi:hypothetical protein [Nonomuraea sp. NPDC049646]|uniref:hypothetical protein n=1 Tax=unclassified Nonomuraea TaxID=2593643 RepID=UPI0037AA9D2D